MALVQSNLVEYTVKGFESKNGTSYRPVHLHLFCEVAMSLDKNEFTCVLSRTDSKIDKDIREKLLIIESLVLEHNLAEYFVADQKVRSLEALTEPTKEQKKELTQLKAIQFTLKFKAIESEDIFKGKIPFDKFNGDFLKELKSYGFSYNEQELRQLNVSGWLTEIVIPQMYSEVLSSYNKQNQRNLFIAVMLDMIQNPAFKECLTEFRQDKSNSNIPIGLFLQSVANVNKEAHSKGLSTSKTFAILPNIFALPEAKAVNILTPVATVEAEHTVTEGEGDTTKVDTELVGDIVEGEVEPTVEGGEEE